MTDHGLASELAQRGLGAYAARILELATPAIRIVTTRCDLQALALGASRFGGVPDLPLGFDWPRYEGRPHAFIAQLDLHALPHPDGSELPRTGWLVFFYEVDSMKWGYDPANRGCARVAWFDADASTLRRTPPPPDASASVHFDATRLQFTSAVDLPDSFDLLFDPLREHMTKAQQDAYVEYASERAASTYHHVLGHPQLVQNDMRLECELVSRGVNVGAPDAFGSSDAAREPARDWMLLLQVDTDEDGPGWMWGDVGRIYFWIRREDVAARRFERAWLVLQCC